MEKTVERFKEGRRLLSAEERAEWWKEANKKNKPVNGIKPHDLPMGMRINDMAAHEVVAELINRATLTNGLEEDFVATDKLIRLRDLLQHELDQRIPK